MLLRFFLHGEGGRGGNCSIVEIMEDVGNLSGTIRERINYGCSLTGCRFLNWIFKIRENLIIFENIIKFK